MKLSFVCQLELNVFHLYAKITTIVSYTLITLDDVHTLHNWAGCIGVPNWEQCDPSVPGSTSEEATSGRRSMMHNLADWVGPLESEIGEKLSLDGDHGHLIACIEVIYLMMSDDLCRRNWRLERTGRWCFATLFDGLEQIRVATLEYQLKHGSLAVWE